MGEYRVDLLPRVKRIEFNPAERYLISCAELGQPCTSADGSLLVVRAEVLRALVTGAPFEDSTALRVHPSGIEMFGALVVGEQLNLSGAVIVAKLWLENCTFAVNATEDQIAQGTVTPAEIKEPDAFLDLTDARGSTLAFKKCALARIKAQRLNLTGNLYLDRSNVPNGIDLHNSRIDGQLSCKGTKVGPHRQSVKAGDHVDGHALDCRAAHFGNSVYLTPEFLPDNSEPTETNPGPLRRLTQMAFRSANPKPSRRHIEVPFEARGKVDFTRSKIKGRFDCRGAKIASSQKFPEDKGRRIAVHCDGIEIEASAMIGDGFHADGEVNFVRARIGADLNATGGTFVNDDAEAGGALNLGSAHIGSGLILDEPRTGYEQSVRTSIVGKLILQQARCEVFADGRTNKGSIKDIVTPGVGKLELDGFVYDRLAHSVASWGPRTEWLLQQSPDHIRLNFRLQPWAQLIQVLKQVGHENDARRLAINREIALRNSGSLGPFRRLSNEVLGRTVGFGYRPLLPVWWSAAFLILGWITFDIAAVKGWMAPRSEEVLVSTQYWAQENCTTPVGYRRFHPAFYTIDVFMPIIEPHLEDDWGPDYQSRPCAQLTKPPWLSLSYWWPKGIDALYERLQLASFFAWGGLDIVRRTLVVVGWIFVPLFLAGVSGIMKKE